MSEIYDIYVDGSCVNINTPESKGGWAYVVCRHNTDEIIFSKKGILRPGRQGSSRAELEAMYQAVKYVKEVNKNDFFFIFTDSSNVEKGMNGKSSRHKTSRDIWHDIECICKDLNNICVKKITAHQELKDIPSLINNIVDEMAKQSARSLVNLNFEEDLRLCLER